MQRSDNACTYWNAKMKEQQKCQAAEDLNPTGANCLVAEPKGKVNKARAKLQILIGKCTPASLTNLDSCGADVTAEQSCVQAAADQCVDQHYADLYEPSGTDGIFVSAALGSPGGAGDISDPVDTIAGGVLGNVGVDGVDLGVELFADRAADVDAGERGVEGGRDLGREGARQLVVEVALEVAEEQVHEVAEDAAREIRARPGGVSFILDSNILALSPVPDAPPITSTVVPTSAGPPILNQFVPGTSTPYDLGFCLSDGFVNRAMAAFMLQGQFNQSLSEIPLGGTNVALTTGILSLITGDSAYGAACSGCSVTLVLKPTSAPVSRAPQPGEDGDVVLIIPNYRLDAFADQGGTPLPLLSANLTFSLPVALNVQASTIAPSVGTLDISNVKVLSNDIGADEGAFATVVEQLFPLAADTLGGLFGQIPLPPFQGLAIAGVDSAYNVSCVGIYMNLN